MSEKDKGNKNGLCNRTSCQSAKNVVFYNSSIGKYYCLTCADLINEANLDISPELLCKTDAGLSPREYSIATNITATVVEGIKE